MQKYKAVAQGLTQVEGIDQDVYACRQVRVVPDDSCLWYRTRPRSPLSDGRQSSLSQQ